MPTAGTFAETTEVDYPSWTDSVLSSLQSGLLISTRTPYRDKKQRRTRDVNCAVGK